MSNEIETPEVDIDLGEEFFSEEGDVAADGDKFYEDQESGNRYEDLEDTFDEMEENDEGSSPAEEDDILDLFKDEEEKDLYQINDYDLSKFKDVIDMENEDDVAMVNEMASELADKGFNQEQMEFFVEKLLEDKNTEESDDVEEESFDPVENLKNTLSRAEKLDYKVVGNFMKKSLDKPEDSARIKEAMMNPHVFRLVRDLYRATVKTEDIVAEKERVKTSIPTVRLKDAYVELIQNGMSKEAALSYLEKKSSKGAVEEALSEFY